YYTERPDHSFYLFVFSILLPPPPSSTLFPYTTLFRSVVTERAVGGEVGVAAAFRGIEVGLAVTDLAHAAAGIGRARQPDRSRQRSEEHTSELQSRGHLVCRLLLEKKKKKCTYTRC